MSHLYWIIIAFFIAVLTEDFPCAAADCGTELPIVIPVNDDAPPLTQIYSIDSITATEVVSIACVPNTGSTCEYLEAAINNSALIISTSSSFPDYEIQQTSPTFTASVALKCTSGQQGTYTFQINLALSNNNLPKFILNNNETASSAPDVELPMPFPRGLSITDVMSITLQAIDYDIGGSITIELDSDSSQYMELTTKTFLDGHGKSGYEIDIKSSQVLRFQEDRTVSLTATDDGGQSASFEFVLRADSQTTEPPSPWFDSALYVTTIDIETPANTVINFGIPIKISDGYSDSVNFVLNEPELESVFKVECDENGEVQLTLLTELDASYSPVISFVILAKRDGAHNDGRTAVVLVLHQDNPTTTSTEPTTTEGCPTTVEQTTEIDCSVCPTVTTTECPTEGTMTTDNIMTTECPPCPDCSSTSFSPFTDCPTTTDLPTCPTCPDMSSDYSSYQTCPTCPDTSSDSSSYQTCPSCPDTSSDSSSYQTCPSCPDTSSDSSSCPTCPTCPDTSSDSSSCPTCPTCPDTSSDSSSCPTCPTCPDTSSDYSSYQTCPSCPDTSSDSSSCPTCPTCPDSSSDSSTCPVCPDVTTESSSCTACPTGTHTTSSDDSSTTHSSNPETSCPECPTVCPTECTSSTTVCPECPTNCEECLSSSVSCPECPLTYPATPDCISTSPTVCPECPTTCPSSPDLCSSTLTECPVCPSVSSTEGTSSDHTAIDCSLCPTNSDCPVCTTTPSSDCTTTHDLSSDCPQCPSTCPTEGTHTTSSDDSSTTHSSNPETSCPECPTVCPTECTSSTTVCPECPTNCEECLSSSVSCPECPLTYPATPDCISTSPTVCPECPTTCPSSPDLCSSTLTECPVCPSVSSTEGTSSDHTAIDCSLCPTNSDCPVCTTTPSSDCTTTHDLSSDCPQCPSTCPTEAPSSVAPKFVESSPYVIGYPDRATIRTVVPQNVAVLQATVNGKIDSRTRYTISQDSDKFIIHTTSGAVYPSENFDFSDSQFEVVATLDGLSSDKLQVQVKSISSEHLAVLNIEGKLPEDVDALFSGSDKHNISVRVLQSAVIPGETDILRHFSTRDEQDSLLYLIVYAIDTSSWKPITSADFISILNEINNSWSASKLVSNTEGDDTQLMPAVIALAVLLGVFVCAAVGAAVFYFLKIRPRMNRDIDEYDNFNGTDDDSISKDMSVIAESPPNMDSPVASRDANTPEIPSSFSELTHYENNIVADFENNSSELQPRKSFVKISDSENEETSDDKEERRKSIVTFNETVQEIEIERF